MHTLHKLYAGLFIVGFLFGSLAPARALQGLTIRPATVSLKLPAGEITTQTLKIINETGKRQTFDALLADYRMASTQKSSIEFLPPTSMGDSLQPMIAIDPQRFDLEDGTSTDVTVRIQPPRATGSGKYKGAVIVGPIMQMPAAGDTGQSQVFVSGKVGSLIGVEVAAAAPEASRISGLTLTNKNNWPRLLVALLLSVLAILILRAGKKKSSR